MAYLRENEQDERQSDAAQALGLGAYDIQQLDLPSMTDSQQYAEIYFSVSTFYLFISQDDFYALLRLVMHLGTTSTWNSIIPVKLALAQVYFVLSLGARFLEVKLNSKFPSHDLFAKGMGYATQIKLHDSIEGMQVLLLLAQHSFYSPEGLNAWFLLHTIIASCLDLGLKQRDNCKKETEPPCHRRTRHLRSAIFRSAYSMDCTLATILGRPLTLRDEAIDREFPGLDNNDEVESAATQGNHAGSDSQEVPEKQSPELASIPYTTCVYSLRFDRIVAEIKLMLYRVSRSPSRFPWPTNVATWQHEAQNACLAAGKSPKPATKPFVNNFGTLSGVSLQRLELKYHHCVMLLYRPSPQIPHPSTEAIQACFSSAMDIISIYADLHRFLNMECSWLSAHSILVAAITVLYCLCSHPAVRGTTPVETCLKRAELAHELLSFLGQSWSVVDEAGLKLDKLITATREAYNAIIVGGGLADCQGYQDSGNMVVAAVGFWLREPGYARFGWKGLFNG